MQRAATVTLAGLLLGGLVTAPAVADFKKPVGPGSIVFTTENGTQFRFGMTLDFQPTFTSDLDFNENTNFRSITEFGAIGEDDEGFIGLETRLFFSAAKGPVSLYTAIELDGTLDEREIDNNNPNIERINLSWQVPEAHSTFTVGADIYLLDNIGGLVYMDDDPGVWVKGGAGPWSWLGGVHKRIEFGGAAGDTGGRFAARAGVTEDRSDDTTFFSGKIGYDIKHGSGKFQLAPFFLVNFRDTPMTGTGLTRLNLVGPGGVARGADPLQTGAVLGEIVPNQTSAYFGLMGTGNVGRLRPSFELVYLTGQISGLTDASGALPFGFEEFDISSYAAYGRLEFDLSKSKSWPLRGAIPFFQVEFLSGDDDPFDNDLEGFVSPSSPGGLRRNDFPLLRKTALGLGGPTLGNGTADFGFATDGRGIGPTIGNIFEGATFGGTALFNNRFGKGDNPGFIKLSAGVQGPLSKKWALHLIGSYLQFTETESIEAEFGSFGIGSVDDEIGFGIDALLVYKFSPNLQFKPFVSAFFPGDGAEQLSGDDATAVIGGVQFFGRF